jgi:hypothetical protein
MATQPRSSPLRVAINVIPLHTQLLIGDSGRRRNELIHRTEHRARAKFGQKKGAATWPPP